MIQHKSSRALLCKRQPLPVLQEYRQHSSYQPSNTCGKVGGKQLAGTEGWSAVTQLSGPAQRVLSESRGKVSLWCLGSWKLTTAGHFLATPKQTKFWHSHLTCLASIWQTNQQKTLRVLKQQDHKGKPAGKFLEALKKRSQMNQVQKNVPCSWETT